MPFIKRAHRFEIFLRRLLAKLAPMFVYRSFALCPGFGFGWMHFVFCLTYHLLRHAFLLLQFRLDVLTLVQSLKLGWSLVRHARIALSNFRQKYTAMSGVNRGFAGKLHRTSQEVRQCRNSRLYLGKLMSLAKLTKAKAHAANFKDSTCSRNILRKLGIPLGPSAFCLLSRFALPCSH